MFVWLMNHLTSDTLASLPGIGVELVLCATILVILLARIPEATARWDSTWLAIVGIVVALGVLSPWAPHDLAPNTAGDASLAEWGRVELFTGMLVYDGWSVVIKTLLLVFLLLFFILVKLTKAHPAEDSADFTVLVLGATLGMCLMASTNHALMLFLAIEMASVPSFALAAFIRSNRKGAEAGLKYAIYGAGTAGVLLYGISLLTGILQTAHLPTMAVRLAEMRAEGMATSEATVLVLAALMIFAGLGFKLSAVPFHQWCPDVFEGTTAEVGAFLSVASKAAALALVLRVVLGVSALETAPLPLVPLVSAASPAVDVTAEAANETAGGEANKNSLRPVRVFLALLLSLVAVVTCTFGNLAAFAQTNIKRLLAYSTIAHAGYMLMAFPPMLLLIGSDTAAAAACAGYLGLYIAVYLFMNLGAFAVVAFVRDSYGGEEIADYAGLVQRSRGLAICFIILLVGLVGLPPLAGFIGKFAVFAGLARGYLATGSTMLIVLLVVGCLNTALSLFYYLRVVKVMTFDPPDERATITAIAPGRWQMGYLWAITVPVLVLIAGWNFLNVWIQQAVRSLIS